MTIHSRSFYKINWLAVARMGKLPEVSRAVLATRRRVEGLDAALLEMARADVERQEHEAAKGRPDRFETT